jgi:hypothetical protein
VADLTTVSDREVVTRGAHPGPAEPPPSLDMPLGVDAAGGPAGAGREFTAAGRGVGGLALGAWALHQGGMSSPHIARRMVAFFVLNSAANFAAVIVFGVGLAAWLLPGRASLALTLGPAVLAAATVAFVLTLPRLLARAPDKLLGARTAGGARASASKVREGPAGGGYGVGDAVGLLREGRLSVMSGRWAICCSTSQRWRFASAFGHLPPLGLLVLAYLVGQLGGLIPVPGGIGGTGGGLIGALHPLRGLAVVAAPGVLAYRVLQLCRRSSARGRSLRCGACWGESRRRPACSRVWQKRRRWAGRPGQ